MEETVFVAGLHTNCMYTRLQKEFLPVRLLWWLVKVRGDPGFFFRGGAASQKGAPKYEGWSQGALSPSQGAPSPFEGAPSLCQGASLPLLTQETPSPSQRAP